MEKYAGLTDDQQELRVKKAQYIMAKYVSADSETEVNLPYSIKQELQKNLARPTKDLFAAAQRSIFLLMVYGTLDYFLKSERYRLYKGSFIKNYTYISTFLFIAYISTYYIYLLEYIGLTRGPM